MGDKAWKRLERDVAKHFGTQRRVRGADFGESDIEIVATLADWLGKDHSSCVGLAVECKYRKNHPIIDIVHTYTTSYQLGIVHIGEYMLCQLDMFEHLWNFVIKNFPTLHHAILYCDIKVLDKKVPKYLDDYRAQAVQYTAHDGMILLPLVCMAQANTKGKVIAVHTADIISFIKAYEILKSKVLQDKARVSQTIN